MDALAGYGSDSDSEADRNKAASGGALSGLLAHYSDDSDGDNNNVPANIYGTKPEGSGRINGGEEVKGMAGDKKVNGGEEEIGTDAQPKKRRRWDNPNEDTNTANIDDVLPPPLLLAGTSNNTDDDDQFQSMMLFSKDYTAGLRQKLSQQLQNQGKDTSKEMHPLNKKLEQLHDKFHQKNDASSAASSFAAHLKSQHEFGNPHLLKNIIDHFSISPLESHVGNSFKSFEYVDRLVPAEERARIVAANYDSGVGRNVGGAPGPGA